MSNELKIEANDVINGLLSQIAQLSQEKAMLQVQLQHVLNKKEETDGGDAVPAGDVGN